MENTVGFEGGLLLPEIPSGQTADTSIIRACPATVTLPVSDTVCAAVGDRVRIGTPLGSHRGLTVYCSVSGFVSQIKNGKITVENDSRDDTAEPFESPPRTSSALIDYMRKISLVGMGGAGFPTAKKYESSSNIRFLLINACECEPHLSCDRALISNRPNLVIRGAQALRDAAGSPAVFICVKHQELLSALKGSLLGDNIRIVKVSKRFPQGSEKQLIAAVLRREVPSMRLPSDCGAVVSNCATAAAFAESLDTGLPPVHRIVTVAGRVGKCANILTPCGTSAEYLISLCGGAEEGSVIIEGGAMTGHTVKSENAFVSLTTSGYLALPPVAVSESPCIHCGACAAVCPSRIVPYRIDAANRQGNTAELERLCADACISCGCCSYVCPAKRELTYNTTKARRAVYSLKEGRK